MKLFFYFLEAAVVNSYILYQTQHKSENPRFTRVLKWPTRAKKGPIYTQTRQINYY
jgi:hypothetical protein